MCFVLDQQLTKCTTHYSAFIISPLDKGGKVYSPSQKLRSLTLPDCEPMEYGLAWLWNLQMHDPQKAEVHTLTIGAARPSDLDQVAVAAYRQGKSLLLSKVQTVSKRLYEAQVEALGQEWLDSCYEGVIKSKDSKYLVEHNQIVWLYNCIKAWGLLEFCRNRFNAFVGNTKKFDPALTNDENIDNIGRRGWGFCPGVVPDANKDYFADDLARVPEKNRAKIKEAYEFVLKWCGPAPEKPEDDKKNGHIKGGGKEDSGDNVNIPKEYCTSFEMKVWKDYPDRKYPY
jgi:hypothetical protein